MSLSFDKFGRLGVSAGGLSPAQVEDCSCPPASADTLSTSRACGTPPHPQSIPLFFPLSDLVVSTIPFPSLASPQICCERLTGGLPKPDPHNGSGGWKRSPRVLEHLGPPEILTPALNKGMELCFSLSSSVVSSSSWLLFVSVRTAQPLAGLLSHLSLVTGRLRDGWRTFETCLEGDSWCQCWISNSTYNV